MSEDKVKSLFGNTQTVLSKNTGNIVSQFPVVSFIDWCREFKTNA